MRASRDSRGMFVFELRTKPVIFFEWVRDAFVGSGETSSGYMAVEIKEAIKPGWWWLLCCMITAEDRAVSAGKLDIQQPQQQRFTVWQSDSSSSRASEEGEQFRSPRESPTVSIFTVHRVLTLKA